MREADRSAPRESRSVQASELDLSLEPESGGSAARGEGTGAMGHARGVAEGPRVTVVGVTENRCPSPDFADEFADKLADRSSDGLSPADMSNKYFCLSSSSDSGSCGSRGVNGMAESENRRRKEIVAKPLAAEDRDSTSAMVAAGYADRSVNANTRSNSASTSHILFFRYYPSAFKFGRTRSSGEIETAIPIIQ